MNALNGLGRLIAFVGTEPLLQRLLLASLEVAVLAIAVSVLVRLTRLRRPRVVCLLWMIVLSKPVVSLTLGSAIPILHLEVPAEKLAAMPADAAGGIAAEPPPDIDHWVPPLSGSVPAEADLLIEATAPQDLAPPAATPPSAPAGSRLRDLPWARIVLAAWLAGVGLALGCHLWTRVRLGRLIRRARPAPGPVADRYRGIGQQLGLRAMPRLRITDRLESPAIVGTLRPVILLPAWLAAEPAGAKLDWSIRHELTHFRWLDPWAGAIRDAALILFWFHPAIWWSANRLVEAMEVACDRAMLHGPADAADYAEQLFRILQNLQQRGWTGVGGGLFATRTQVGRRIAALVENPFTRSPQLTLLSAMGLILAAAAAFAFGGRVGVGVGVAGPPAQASASGQRVLHFPKDRSLGRLQMMDVGVQRQIQDFHHWIDGTKWEYLGDARGDVVVPAGKRVLLWVNETSCKDLSPLARLAPDDLYELTVAYLPADDRCMAHIGRLTGLKALHLMQSNIGDAGLRQLRGMKSLERLSLPKGLTDAGMAHIGQLKSLKALYFGHNRVSDKGLAHLENLTNLEELELGGAYVNQAGKRVPSLMTGAGLVHVGRLPSLRYLLLWGDFNDDGLEHLKECRSLRILNVSHLDITDAGLAKIAQVTWLENLDLFNTKVTDKGLVHLKSMRSLKKLDLDYSPNDWSADPKNAPITDAGLVSLGQIRTLEYLTLPCYGITDSGLANLAELDRLTTLKVSCYSNSPVTDAGLRHLEGLHALEKLTIGGTGITGAGIALLARLPGLKDLFLMVARADRRELEALAAIKPLESLSLFVDEWLAMSALNRLSGMPNLTSLKVFNIRRDGEALNLANLPHLESLSLSCAPGTRLEDQDMVWLAQLKQVKTLQIGSFEGDAITDAGMAHLAGLTALEDIGIGGSGVTDRGLQYIADKQRIWRLTVQGNFTDQGLRQLEGLTALRALTIRSSGKFSPAAVQRLRSRLSNLNRYSTIEGNKVLAPPDPHHRPRRIGDVALPFTEETLDGKKISMSDYRGKCILLYFWGTWCAPCVAGTPGLKKFHADMSARYKDFALISLSMDDSEAKVRDFVKEHDLTWPQVRIGLKSRIAYYFGTRDSAPHYFLISPEGKIALIDEMNYNKIEAAVARLLSHSPAATAPASRGVLPPGAETRVYDVSDITSQPAEAKAPSQTPEQEAELRVRAAQGIADMVRNKMLSLHADSAEAAAWWRGNDSIRIWSPAEPANRGNVLIIQAMPADHDQIRTLLADVRQDSKIRISVECQVISVPLPPPSRGIRALLGQTDTSPRNVLRLLPKEALESATLQPDGYSHRAGLKSTFMDDGQVERLVNAVKADGQCTILTAPRVVLRSGQQARVEIQTSTAYVADLKKVTDATGKTTFEPQMGQIPTGSWFDFGVTASRDGRNVKMNLKSNSVRLVSLVNVRHDQAGATVQMPITWQCAFEETVAIPTDRTQVLVGQELPTDPREPKGTKERLILLVTPRIITAAEEPARGLDASTGPAGEPGGRGEASIVQQHLHRSVAVGRSGRAFAPEGASALRYPWHVRGTSDHTVRAADPGLCRPLPMAGLSNA